MPSQTSDHATPGDAFTQALREAVQRRGLGLERLRARLEQRGTPVSLATLSYWQSGRSRPERPQSLEALKGLEEILELREGELLDLLPPPRRRGGVATPTVERSALMPRSELVYEVLEELAVDDKALIRLSVHDLYLVDADRQNRVQQVRQVHRAEVDGARSWPVVHLVDDDGPRTAPQLTALSGCTIGELHEDATVGLVVAEMLLPRPLSRGETALSEYKVEVPPTEEASRVERSSHHRVRELVIQVEFDGAAVPSTCQGYAVVDGEESWWPVPVAPHGSAHLLMRDFGPGVCGLRWEW